MIVNLSGEVNDEMYNKVFKTYIDVLNNKELINKLDIFINTGGGDVEQGLAIFDIIQLMKKNIKVRTIATGLVASAGITIYLAGSTRLATPNATFMVHYGETSCSGYSEMLFNKKVLDLHIEMLYNKLLVTKKTIKSWHNGDHYFDTERAYEIGLVEYIL